MDDPARPLLTQVRAKHFKSLGDLSLDLGPLTVLVGPNGSGKSNVVAVLRFLRDAATRGLNYAFGEQGGSVTIPQRGHRWVELGGTSVGKSGSLSYGMTLNGESDRLKLESEYIKLNDKSDFYVETNVNDKYQKSDKFYIKNKSKELILLSDQSLIPAANLSEKEWEEKWSLVEASDNSYESYSRIGIYNPEASILRRAQREIYAYPFEEDGRNLAATLAAIRETPDGKTIDRVLELLVEGAVGYHVEPAASFLIPFVDYAGQGDGQTTSSDLGLESDGTIRMMAMLAALYQTPPRSLIVLEEPEAGLHPGALSVLAEVIKEASTRCQVVITTHSPDLIDCFDLDSLRVVEKVNGETRVGPVRPAQQEAVRRKLFSPGELMRMEGLQLDLG